MNPNLLHNLTWPVAKKRLSECDIALLPVGSTEQHGPQNPLGTDHLIAYALAKEAAQRCDVLCLPVIPFGVSSHHRHFPGTISVSPSSLRSYVRDVLLSLYHNNIRKVVIVNGHGGNLYALLEVARELRESRKVFVAIFQWWHAIKGKYPLEEEGHAAALETSLNLYLHGSLVDRERITDEVPSEGPLGGVNGVYIPWETKDFTKSGVMGVATTATADKGKEVFEIALDQLCLLIAKLRELPLKDLLEEG